MTGWNMPPGVNENDIPGNRPEDAAWERFIEALGDAVVDPWDDSTEIRACLEAAYQAAYDTGWVEGQAEMELNRALNP